MDITNHFPTITSIPLNKNLNTVKELCDVKSIQAQRHLNCTKAAQLFKMKDMQCIITTFHLQF